ncbi:glutathione ABC transporter substrate-binding protein [Pseudonocardia sulfidoxydans NBRC 16205]|uniref:Glutathione ABC transporter substrate-binding protein n=1 Tax=Pseudonocardia sulfidoxydans NBRC 16205 TaxID=1223511 RepID=A0A511DIF2_9PSEU|nr:ABC transporter substrate-binding protein [Pseudonocardia sulfidoxydans]GEL24592.1 glutathione ABC transporter substrate-binding protein [Pseudonocardia sulfidoxydans NBRC 16205]
MNRSLPRRWPTRAAVAVLAVGTLLLTACGSNAGGGADGPELRTVNPFGDDLATEAPAKNGGTLILAEDREIVSFDPTIQNSNMAALAVYDSLLKLDDKGVPQPYLAKSMDTTDNGTTWRMGLRPEVTFSDGTPLDAQSVITNVQRHIDKKSSPSNRYAVVIGSMRAVDPTTVEFTLKNPSGTFPQLFALPFSSGNLGTIVSPKALQEKGEAGIAKEPVGAGPFVFSSWVRDSKLTLSKNPNYWQQGLPHLDGLEFRPLPDTETRYASIENGDVDVMFGGYHTELIRGLGNPNLKVYYGSGNGAEYIYFNQQKAPFDDRRMREAVIRSIDLNALAASQYRGQMERASGYFGDDTPYSTQQSRDSWPAFDIEKAKQLVADYKAGGGNATVQYKTTNAPNRVAFAEFLQAQLKAAGIDIQVQFYDLAQYSSSVVQSHDFQIAGWVGGPTDTPFPGAYNLFHSGGSTNYGEYSNPQVDALLDTAVSTTDPDELAKAYQQVQQLTNDDLAVAYYSRGYLSTIAKPEVEGMQRYLTRDTFFANMWLDR